MAIVDIKEIWIYFLDESGAILAEALIVIPVITIFAAGVVEFGNVFWQRHQMELGVSDAARYWSRCRPTFQNCTLTIARNIAFYGTPDGSGGIRVPGWDQPEQLAITPANPPISPAASDIVVATGISSYQSSPLFGWLGIQPISLQYVHQERYIGW